MYVFGLSKKYKQIGFHILHGSYKYMHTHKDFWEFMITIEGNYIHNINDENVKLKPNTLCVIRPSDCHAIFAAKDSVCSHLNIIVKEDYLKKIFSVVSFDIYEKLKKMKNPSFLISTMETNEIVNECNMILSNTKKHDEDAVLAMFLSVVKILTRKFLAERTNAPTYSNLVSNLFSLINNKANLKLNLKELTLLSGYSYRHVCRKFQQETGKNLFKYFSDEKISYAKTLLSDTNYTLEKISGLLGYSSAYAFSTAFKNKIGISPSFYAKNHPTEYEILSSDDKNLPDDL